MEDAAAPPAAPAPPAATAPDAPSPPAPSAAPAGFSAPPPDAPGPSPGQARASRLRLQAKVAGFILMLFGAFFTVLFATSAYSGAQRSTWEREAGGEVLVDARQPDAPVTLLYANGTADHAVTGADGTVLVKAQRAAFQLSVAARNATYTRQAIVPPGTRLDVTLAPDAPLAAQAGLDPGSLRVFWLVALAAAAIAVGGTAAFRLRGPRVAMGGALLFLLGAALLLALSASLLALSFAGTAVLCATFVYRARAEFRPLRTPAAR